MWKYCGRRTFFFSPLSHSLLPFRQLHCHNSYFSLGHSPYFEQSSILGRNFDNYWNSYLSLLSHNFSLIFYTFFLEFWQYHCRNLLLSLFSQINLNSVHVTNKLHFFAIFSRKTLEVEVVWLIRYDTSIIKAQSDRLY